MDMGFGRGQPSTALGGGGIRAICFSGHLWGPVPLSPEVKFILTTMSSASLAGIEHIRCSEIRKLDQKIDDGRGNLGRVQPGQACGAGAALLTWDGDYSNAINAAASSVVFYMPGF
jgi:hypothetical protein